MTMISDATRREHVSGAWRLPRSRGLAAGITLIVLGCWAGLVPFVGPYFGYAYTPASPWEFTWGRLWLEILPAVAAVAGGILLTAAANRLATHAGGWLAVAAGGWLLIGPPLSRLWAGGVIDAGHPIGGGLSRAVEQIGFFTGLGGVLVAVAALALGRLSVRSIRDVRVAEKRRAARRNDTEQTDNTAQTGSADTVTEARAEGQPETGPAGQDDQQAPDRAAEATTEGGAYEASRPEGHEADREHSEPAAARRTSMTRDSDTAIDKLAGKAKKAAGRVSGNDQDHGESEQPGGGLSEKAGQARDKAGNALGKASEAVRRRRSTDRGEGEANQPTGQEDHGSESEGAQPAGEAHHAGGDHADTSEATRTFREAGQKAGEALDAAREGFRNR